MYLDMATVRSINHTADTVIQRTFWKKKKYSSTKLHKESSHTQVYSRA
jgi:hypothetical protein